MIINVSRIDNKVIGIGAQISPLDYHIAVRDDFKLDKTIPVVEGTKQKVDDVGKPLYKIINIIQKITPYIDRYEETTDSVGATPIYIEVQDKDTNGNPLYYSYDGENPTTEESYVLHIPLEPAVNENNIQRTERIADEDGETSGYLPLYKIQVGFEWYETTARERIEVVKLNSILKQVQKSDENGNSLYLKAIESNKIEDIEEIIETTESNIPTRYEDQEFPVYEEVEEEIDGIKTGNLIQVQTGTEIKNVPVEFKELEPIMIDNIVNKVVWLQDNPTEFNLDEILEAKYSELLNGSTFDYIIADIFLSEADLDLEWSGHSADTGRGILVLHEYGVAKLKPIALSKPADTFEVLELDGEGTEIRINGITAADNKVTLPAPVEVVEITFVNNTDSKKRIKSYAIAY